MKKLEALGQLKPSLPTKEEQVWTLGQRIERAMLAALSAGDKKPARCVHPIERKLWDAVVNTNSGAKVIRR